MKGDSKGWDGSCAVGQGVTHADYSRQHTLGNESKKMNLIEYWMCLNILRKDLDNWRVCEDKLVMNI